jgi:serine/threonine protein kinase
MGRHGKHGPPEELPVRRGDRPMADPCSDGDDVTTWGFSEQSEIVPGYFAWDLLGVGRRFEMWIAWCAERLTPVCIKIPRGDDHTERTLDALRRELAAATSFNHPAIPRVFASDLTTEMPYIVYEFIEGRPLSAVIEDDGPMASNDVVLLGMQVAVALRHIHRQGFVHLDLKPANIALRGDRAMVFDFDIALPIGGQRSQSKPRGTRWYMPPEQIRCEPAQPGMDIFALGAVLYEAATATLAYGQDTRSDEEQLPPADPAGYRQLGPPIPTVAELVPTVWPPLAQAIDTMLRPDPGERPADASEALDLLASALPPDGEPLWPDWVNGLHRTTPPRRQPEEPLPGTQSPTLPPASVLEPALRVDVIDTPEGFAALRSTWEAIHQRDPHAGYFLSWRWLAEVVSAYPDGWIVLGVRPEGRNTSYVCFLPLRVKERWSSSRREVVTELEPAGRLLWGQYSGFVCEPELERSALPALADFVRNLTWTKLTLKHLSQPEHRTRLFVGGFDPRDYRVTYPSSSVNGGAVDGLVCPYVQLPTDFETYLRSSVSSNTRQKIRRYARRIDASNELHITIADPTTFERDLDVLLELWWKRWAPRRGADTADAVTSKYREILTHSFALDAVLLPVLWRNGKPLGALASIIDREARALHFIVAGRDEEAADQFIGIALHSHSIKWAIENRFATYDFCHGNEAYKYSFGAVDRVVKHVSIFRSPA